MISVTFVILLDLSAAFDSIDYDVLCDVLQCRLGIYATALHILRSFLQGRSQSVITDEIQSGLKQLTCDVPQCSVLGLLSSVYKCSPYVQFKKT